MDPRLYLVTVVLSLCLVVSCLLHQLSVLLSVKHCSQRFPCFLPTPCFFFVLRLRFYFYSSSGSSLTQHGTCFHCYIQLAFFCLKLFKSLYFVGTHVLPSLNTELGNESCKGSVPAPGAEPLWEANNFLFSRKSSIWISSSKLPLATRVPELSCWHGLKIGSFSASWCDWGSTETAGECNLLGSREACDFWQCEVAWIAVCSGWSREYFCGLTGGTAGVSTIRGR